MRFSFPCGVLAGLILVGLPITAAAHAQYKPFSTNRYTEITFGESGLRIVYTITVGDLPAQKLKERADDDGNGFLDRSESDPLLIWVKSLLSKGLKVELDGTLVPLQAKRAVLDLTERETKRFAPIRFRFLFEVPCPPGRHSITYHDGSMLPAIEQTELYVRAGAWANPVQIRRSAGEPDGAPRMFWNEGKRPTPVWIRFGLRERPAGTDEAGSERPPSLVDDTGPLKKALADPKLGFWGLLSVLGLSFFLGAVHALSPGHGKTLVAAYLVGTRGKIRHAIALGLVVTFTHIFSVVILGLIALWASEKVLPERLAPWLSLAAGVIVLGMGIWMVISRRRARHAHHHHDHHPHDHTHDHTHDHAHGHDHHHHGEPAGEERPVKWSELMLLGISGGMVPCLSATVVLLFAVYLGKIAAGLLLILAFSLGLSATLVILGILVVRGRKLIERWSQGPRTRKLVSLLPLFSAAAVTILGGVMVVLAALEL